MSSHLPPSRAARPAWSALSGLLLALSACGASPSGEETCQRGRLGCSCTAEGQCEDDLACSEGTCRAQESVQLVVLDPRARACEVLLDERDSRLLGVSFADDMQGTQLREAPRTAVAFVSRDDRSIPEDAVTVHYEANQTSPEVEAVTCTDVNGAPIAGAKVELRG